MYRSGTTYLFKMYTLKQKIVIILLKLILWLILSPSVHHFRIKHEEMRGAPKPDLWSLGLRMEHFEKPWSTRQKCLGISDQCVS